jgi:dihydroorotate dehydrogenase (fumarate)
MSDLTTNYLGLTLPSPLVISSNPLCANPDTIVQLAENGAGAVILPSLFEEQIELEDSGQEWYREHSGFDKPAALAELPKLTQYNKGVGGYLALLYQARRRVNIPVIASLNGSSQGGWIRYAKMLAGVGADALELNIYYLPTQEYVPGTEIEDMYIRLVEAVKKEVAIPVAVKLNPYFSSLPYMAKRLVEAGADGLVLFNRFYQPDFDLAEGKLVSRITYSTPEELMLRLRWAAIISSRVPVHLGITGGVHTYEHLLKSLIAGGQVGMMTTAVLRNGPEHIALTLQQMNQWLDEHNFPTSNALRQHWQTIRTEHPIELLRVNYINVLKSYYDDKK